MRSLLFSILPAAALYAGCVPPNFEPPDLSGTLLVTVPETAPQGHVIFISYLPVTVVTGVYDNHWEGHQTPRFTSLSPQLFTLTGITQWMDFQFNPGFTQNWSQGATDTAFLDLPIGFDFQLWEQQTCAYAPGVKLFVGETFPTGKYHHLSAEKMGTDIGGLGSYQTVLSLLFYKVIHLTGIHYMTLNLFLQETFFRHVHVEGINAFGGTRETSGNIFPGANFQAFLSYEIKLTEHFEFVMDNVYIHNNHTSFYGNRGSTSLSSLRTSPAASASISSSLNLPSSDSFSMAPGFSYTFSGTSGIILGSWFTYAGRNSPRFWSGIFEYYLQF